MPEINKVFSLRVTPEQFLDACSPLELHEVEMLISKPQYQDKMTNQDIPVPKNPPGPPARQNAWLNGDL